MKKTDKAYLAGLIDGEGCIFIAKVKSRRGKKGYRFQSGIHVAMASFEMIRWIHQVTGVGSIHKLKRRSPRHKIAWVWAVRDRKAVFVLNLIKSFLRLKRNQAKTLMTFQSRLKWAGPSGATNKEWAIRKRYWRVMRKLNKSGA